jgi:hypothetical protein
MLIEKAVDITPYNQIHYLKGTNTTKGKATLWFIYDMNFKEVKRVRRLSEEEKKYPVFSRIDDRIMVERIDQHWVPEKDPAI